nr:hypothetical protein [Kibdelosporangium sp. MJ126-NF4]CTQ96949.1 hypothetical protein [Kibdelosporangium sp. MJ126-NF4]
MQHRKEDTPHAAEVSPGPYTWERTRFVDHGHTRATVNQPIRFPTMTDDREGSNAPA